MDGGVSGPEDDAPLGSWMVRTWAQAAKTTIAVFDTYVDAMRWCARERVVPDVLTCRWMTSDAGRCNCRDAQSFAPHDKVRLGWFHPQLPGWGWHHPYCRVVFDRISASLEEPMEQPEKQQELPKYRSHKIVSAVKIADVSTRDGLVAITPADGGLSPFLPCDQWRERVPPAVLDGMIDADLGYFVRYADGFESWSPSKAFEEGYARVAVVQGGEAPPALHQALPVKGYSPQSGTATDAVNANKVLEEQCLRQLEAIRDDARLEADGRSLALAITKLQEAFMWANRAIFKPRRIDI